MSLSKRSQFLRTEIWMVFTYSLALVGLCFLGGCGAASHRDTAWNNYFKQIDYVTQQLKPQVDKNSKDKPKPLILSSGNWIKDYYDTLARGDQATENDRRDKRNRVINGYLLLADSAYGKFESGYNDEIATFEIGADMVNLGLTAASAVTAPAALLGAAATGGLGVQHSLEKNALNSQTRYVITNRMSAIRQEKRTEILQRELKPVCGPTTSIVASGQQLISDVCYTLEDGLRDVQEYFYLGSIHRALASIDTETQKINQQTPNSPTPASPAAPVITSANTTTFTVGTLGTFTIAATGAPPPTLTETGNLPNGVQFNTATGALSGTPSQGTAGTYAITFGATNGQGVSAVQNFTLRVIP